MDFISWEIGDVTTDLMPVPTPGKQVISTQRVNEIEWDASPTHDFPVTSMGISIYKEVARGIYRGINFSLSKHSEGSSFVWLLPWK